jgi:serine/threonine-protein kinase HipA
MSKILDVYFRDVFIGKLEHHPSDRLTFQYDTDYLEAKNSPAISIALPKQKEPHDDNHVKAYFSGLLPDDIARHRLARFLGISEKNSFSLLEMIGGECAGALSFYPHGKKPPEHFPEDIEIIDDNKLQTLLGYLKEGLY